ncbi:putative transcription factor At1g61730 [Bidens hawaiensis]|uniref:putative transcription factor At1g61730 n=1 Tax=Bidens hawaiensis TaxID=980011 RepID=UPI00404AAFD2
MAHNQLNPNYSSSDDEEEASGSDDDQPSGSDSDQLSDELPNPQKTLISDSQTDSDSDLPPAVDPDIKPISSVPMEFNLNPNPDSKLIIKSLPMAGSKRLPANDNNNINNNFKIAKTSVGAVDDDSKKQLFQRLWSENDEIVILKGLIDYKAETGESLIADMGAFHEFIKKSLHVDVSRAQLVDKIRRLRKKYVNNASREKGGKDRSFSKSHEREGYELSKLIWGGGNAASTSNGVDDKEGVMVEVVEKSVDINRFVRYGGRDDGPVVTEEIVKAGMELVEGPRRVELEEKWMRLKKEELEIYLKKMELIKEQALVVLEAVNSSGS